jgi:predicted N-acetyltransferase YhbS
MASENFSQIERPQKTKRRMHSVMKARPLDPSECDELGEITVRAYRSLYGGESLGPYEDELRNVKGRMRDSEVYAAEDDHGRLMGGVTFVPGSESAMSEFDDPDAAGIRMLAVDPNFQAQGAGRALVETCIVRARGQKRSKIILHSTPLMSVAHSLYRQLGFTATPDLDLYFRDDTEPESEPFHLMAFTLTLEKTASQE